MGDEVAHADPADADAPWRPGYGDEPTVDDAPETPTDTSDAIASEPEPGYQPGADTRPAVVASAGAALGAEPSPWSRAGAESDREPVMRWRPDEVAEAAREEREARLRAHDATPVHPIAHVEGAPASSVTGEVVLAAVGVLAALMVGLVAVIVLRPEATAEIAPDRSEQRLTIPETVPERWRVVLDVPAGVVRLEDGIVLVAGDEEVHALDAATGDTLWTALVGGALTDLALIDDTIAVVAESRLGTTSLVGLDVDTGAERWRDSQADLGHGIIEGSVFEFSTQGVGRTVGVRRLDAATGEAIDRFVVAADVVATRPYVAVEAGERVQLYDVADLRPVANPVDAFELQTLSLVGDSVVGFDQDATIVVFDRAGRRSDERPFVSDAFGDFTGRAELVGGVPGHEVGIVASGSSLGFGLVDGQVDVLWTLPGRMGAPVETEAGPIGVARVVDDATGEINWTLVAALDGRTLAVTDAGVTREDEPIVGWNGYVVAPQIGAAERIVVGHDLTGAELWRLPLAPGADYHVGASLALEVDAGPGETTIVAHG